MARKPTITGRLCAVQNDGGGCYIELSTGTASPVFADQGMAMAWFHWVRMGARGAFNPVGSSSP